MLHTLAISGYRSLKQIVLCMGQLNLITGPNGSGKSNIYRALRLLSSLGEGRLIQSLAREGGLQSTLWAGAKRISSEQLDGKVHVQGSTKKKQPVALKLGFSTDEFSYTIDLGLPPPPLTAFGLDPIIKRECMWRGTERMPSTLCADRRGQNLRIRSNRKWEDIHVPLARYSSMLTEFADPVQAPELILMREAIREWRFYDQFRTDANAPARRTEIGTYTPVLSNDGADLAAALQSIIEMGDVEALSKAIDDAFPGSRLRIVSNESRFEITLEQDGMLRPLHAAELSDGTMRYLYLCAALLTPSPPELMVLNEPETSLHPELLPALANLIENFAATSQLIVVSHAKPLVKALSRVKQCVHFNLEKVAGMTILADVNPLEIPNWKWPAR